MITNRFTRFQQIWMSLIHEEEEDEEEEGKEIAIAESTAIKSNAVTKITNWWRKIIEKEKLHKKQKSSTLVEEDKYFKNGTCIVCGDKCLKTLLNDTSHERKVTEYEQFVLVEKDFKVLFYSYDEVYRNDAMDIDEWHEIDIEIGDLSKKIRVVRLTKRWEDFPKLRDFATALHIKINNVSLSIRHKEEEEEEISIQKLYKKYAVHTKRERKEIKRQNNKLCNTEAVEEKSLTTDDEDQYFRNGACIVCRDKCLKNDSSHKIKVREYEQFILVEKYILKLDDEFVNVYTNSPMDIDIWKDIASNICYLLKRIKLARLDKNWKDVSTLHNFTTNLCDKIYNVSQHLMELEEQEECIVVLTDESHRSVSELEEEVDEQEVLTDESVRSGSELEEEMDEQEVLTDESDRSGSELEEEVDEQEVLTDESGRSGSELEEEMDEQEVLTDESVRSGSELEEEVDEQGEEEREEKEKSTARRTAARNSNAVTKIANWWKKIIEKRHKKQPRNKSNKTEADEKKSSTTIEEDEYFKNGTCIVCGDGCSKNMSNGTSHEKKVEEYKQFIIVEKDFKRLYEDLHKLYENDAMDIEEWQDIDTKINDLSEKVSNGRYTKKWEEFSELRDITNNIHKKVRNVSRRLKKLETGDFIDVPGPNRRKNQKKVGTRKGIVNRK
ncbi:uncharacterized protein LOC130655528 isoform X2 [Hydractinia symbiolongicarpus]|uniref:uncharacterized protein LOC130655528 isoform X2 n=1 Tax=Hydractinia symbiolongicarpus TaxID=13093 RepID=UPI00254CD94B|nr:uncharacterized protein LOC130655528 isoform X2 [Hydractinia symbiolongicarpus]